MKVCEVCPRRQKNPTYGYGINKRLLTTNEEATPGSHQFPLISYLVPFHYSLGWVVCPAILHADNYAQTIPLQGNRKNRNGQTSVRQPTKYCLRFSDFKSTKKPRTRNAKKVSAK